MISNIVYVFLCIAIPVTTFFELENKKYKYYLEVLHNSQRQSLLDEISDGEYLIKE